MTWTAPSGRPPSPAARPRYLRSLCTAAVAISCVQSSCRAAPPFASPPNLLPFPSSRLTFAGTKHSQPQRSVSPRHSWSTGLAVSTPCNACRSSLFLEGDSCSQDSFLGKCVLLHVEIILDKFRPKWAACIKRVSTPNSGAKIHLPGDAVKGGL